MKRGLLSLWLQRLERIGTAHRNPAGPFLIPHTQWRRDDQTVQVLGSAGGTSAAKPEDPSSIPGNQIVKMYHWLTSYKEKKMHSITFKVNSDPSLGVGLERRFVIPIVVSRRQLARALNGHCYSLVTGTWRKA